MSIRVETGKGSDWLCFMDFLEGSCGGDKSSLDIELNEKTMNKGEHPFVIEHSSKNGHNVHNAVEFFCPIGKRENVGGIGKSFDQAREKSKEWQAQIQF